jgi:hypothetical protein
VRVRLTVFAILGALACSPIEDLPSQAEQIYHQLGECGGHLGDAEFQACGEAVLDGFELGWSCICDRDVEAWDFCGTREDVEVAVESIPSSCHCDRVGACS